MELDRLALEAKYSAWTNDELLAAKYLNRGDYTPQAQEIIDQVLLKRNISSEVVDKFTRQMSRETATEYADLVPVKSYSSEIDASMGSSLLGSVGIVSYIKKDDGGGYYPQLQMSTGVQLLVNPEDMAAAMEVLEEAEKVEKENKVVKPPDTSNKIILAVMICLVVGIAIGYMYLPKIMGHRKSSYTGVITQGINKDGKASSFYYYEKGTLVRLEADRNHDGIIDVWCYYEAGEVKECNGDNNFDGKIDEWSKYKDHDNYEVEIDTDFNGMPDATMYYVDGLLKQVDWHSNGSSVIVKREVYEHGVKRYDLLDTKNKGNFDVKVSYDSFGNVTKKN
jgi:hypothetical protein